MLASLGILEDCYVLAFRFIMMGVACGMLLQRKRIDAADCLKLYSILIIDAALDTFLN